MADHTGMQPEAVLTGGTMAEAGTGEGGSATGHNVETGESRELRVSSVLRPECL
jgi:hypothetical protein